MSRRAGWSFERTALLVAALVLGLAACDGDSDGSEPGAQAADGGASSQFFFAQTASSGTLGEGRLVLDDVSPSVLAVSVRPLRSEQRIPVADFSASWDERFSEDAPNAVLSAVVGSDEEDLAVVLSDPSYDSTAARVEYAVEPVDGNSLPTWDFGRATLFIDSAPDNSYVLDLRFGNEPPATLRLASLADWRVVATPGEQPGEITFSEESCECDGFFQLANMTQEPIEAEILQGDVPITSEVIQPNGTWSWQP